VGGGATVQPTNSSFGGSALSSFDGEDSTGTWTLKAIDAVSTPTCASFSSTDIPKSTSAGGTLSSTLSVPASSIGSTITDVNLLSNTGTASRFSRVKFTLVAPDNTSVALTNTGNCTSTHQTWSFKLDDSGTNNNATACSQTPVGNGQTWSPATFGGSATALAGFNGKEAAGTWTLQTIVSSSTATQSTWGLEICATGATPAITAWGLQMCVTD
jgi:subtilisin-like proprotein convertase family protein